MGYTHYFDQKLPAHPARWDKAIRDIHALLDNLPEHSMSAGGYYADDPLEIEVKSINADEIRINGKDGPEDLGHEDFLIRRVSEGQLSFCKTARKPYDLVVCAILIVLDDYLPGVYEIKSDGTTDEWMAAKTWASNVLGRPMFLPVNIKCPRRVRAA